MFPFEPSLAFYLQVRGGEGRGGGGNTKARGGKINSCTAKVLNMKGPTLSFLLVPSVSFSRILFFPLTDREVGIKGSPRVCVCVCVCVSVRGGVLEFNVVSVPRARGSFQRVRQPVVMTL